VSVVAFEIPLSATPQTLSVSLVGVTYNLTVRWNDISRAWVIDLYDQNNSLLIGSIPMVTGEDLLAPYGYLNIGGQLIVQTDTDTLAVPTFENLGATSHLYFIPN
jgi:hypothetical protein